MLWLIRCLADQGVVPMIVLGSLEAAEGVLEGMLASSSALRSMRWDDFEIKQYPHFNLKPSSKFRTSNFLDKTLGLVEVVLDGAPLVIERDEVRDVRSAAKWARANLGERVDGYVRLPSKPRLFLTWDQLDGFIVKLDGACS